MMMNRLCNSDDVITRVGCQAFLLAMAFGIGFVLLIALFADCKIFC